MSENVPTRAAGYVRVSQERNARNGYGLEAQQTDIRRYAEYRGLGRIGIYREAGVSGYERERPELERLLADAKAGTLDVVIFPSIDRTARSVKDVIEIDTALREAGVDIVFLREGIDTSTPVGEFFRNVMASLAQLEGRLIYERMSKGKRRKAAEGGYTGGWLPYGYRLEGGRAVVVPKEAKVVERVFRWRVEGRTLEAICERLNADSVKTQRNGKWRVSTVRGMLANRFYTGRVEFEGELIRAQHDAIVSDMLFRQAAGGNRKGR
jgi:DNA invertase Pin-like site-specific DNA recombinase